MLPLVLAPGTNLRSWTDECYRARIAVALGRAQGLESGAYRALWAALKATAWSAWGSPTQEGFGRRQGEKPSLLKSRRTRQKKWGKQAQLQKK